MAMTAIATAVLHHAVVLGAGTALAGLAAGMAAPAAQAVECELPLAPVGSSAPASYTSPGHYRYAVPQGVTALQVAVAGAAGAPGGNPNSQPGGAGTLVNGIVPVTPGQTVQVLVGGMNGHGGWGKGGRGGGGDNGGYSGGNGGSGSAVVDGTAQIVAGAGGGTGGRSARQDFTHDEERGGAGGGSVSGLNGQDGYSQSDTRARGGVGGYESGNNGGRGNTTQGKIYGDFGGGGGGAGAGWQGGRGGGAGNGSPIHMMGGGGGGAGSSYTASGVTGTTQQTGENHSNGYVTITVIMATSTHTQVTASDPRVARI